MKKSEGYLLKRLEEEYVVLPVGERAEEVNEVMTLSETAGFMYLHAEEADTIEELAEIVSRAYKVDVELVLEDVRMTIAFLREKGVLL